MNYEETFSPMVMIKYIRIFLTIVVGYDYGIWQMDVKNAFLNGCLKKEIYQVTFVQQYVLIDLSNLIRARMLPNW